MDVIPVGSVGNVGTTLVKLMGIVPLMVVGGRIKVGGNNVLSVPVDNCTDEVDEDDVSSVTVMGVGGATVGGVVCSGLVLGGAASD